MINALIIDDEADGRETLQLALEKYCPQVHLQRSCDTPEAGLEAIALLQPDLVFLDVQMPHLSGFDLLQRVPAIAFEVIFVTAYDRYAVKAIRFSALDYLVKPLDVEELVHAVHRVQVRLQQKHNRYPYHSLLHNAQAKSGKIERLAIPTFEGIDFLNTDEIIYCAAEGNYTMLYLTNKGQKLVSRPLKDFESMLSESDFCRVHHSFLINLKHIRKYVKGEGGYVMLTHDHCVEVSRRKKEEFLQLLRKL